LYEFTKLPRDRPIAGKSLTMVNGLSGMTPQALVTTVELTERALALVKRVQKREKEWEKEKEPSTRTEAEGG
jgi:hypothetical protein